ncbi:MAG: iron ABC transporter permease [Rhodothalassiaceae bacterium]
MGFCCLFRYLANMTTPPEDHRRRHGGRAALLLALLAAGFIALPVAVVTGHLFLPASDVSVHLFRTVLPGYVSNTLVLGLGVGVLTLVIGGGLAWLVTMHDFPGRSLFEWALILPLAAPAYVLAYAYTDLLDISGPVQSGLRMLTGADAQTLAFPEIRSLGGAILILSLALYPYVYLTARAAFLQQCECIVEAARTLGAGPFTAFRRVALPMARPALAAGVALALMETFADYGAVAYFGVPTFTTGIYRAWYSFGDPVAAARLASLLLGAIMLLMLLERMGRRHARYHDTSRRVRPLGIQRLSGGRALLAMLVCALPLMLGFLLPAARLLALALKSGATPSVRYLGLVSNSVLLASTTAILALMLAVPLAYIARSRKDRPTRLLIAISGMGYAIPGSIIAVGVLIPFAALDRRLAPLLEALFGYHGGLVLTGSIAALVFALLVRFLALALQTSSAGLAKITPSIDAAARSLGSTPMRLLLRVHAPLLKAPLFSALLLVFVEVIKELPATLIMRPFNFDTLAVAAHNLAADERLAEAALPALSIMACGLVPVWLLSRLIARARPGHGARQNAPLPITATPV